MKSICTAISNLPPALLTEEIINAAIKEGDIKLLDCLPQNYLTSEVVEGLISCNEKSYSSFSLDNIPQERRTVIVCNYAVKKDLDNFSYVPVNLINGNMLSTLMASAKEAFKYLPLIPCHLWTREIVYMGIASLCYNRNSHYNYGRAHYYVNDSDSEKLKLIQILLSYVPQNIKTHGFYLGLFNHKELTVENIDFLTPKKFKQGKYYTLMAERCFHLVPQSAYCYDIFMSALGPQGTSDIHSLKDIEKNIINCMDGRMADVIISKTPTYFKKLPSKFKTERKLITAINKGDNYYDHSLIDEKEDIALLTEKVCKAYVANTTYLPNFPKSIWTKGFINYCKEHAKGVSWFEQLPKELQTVDIVEYVVNKWYHNIRYARKELISLSLAIKLHRKELESTYSCGLKEYIPENFYDDFVNMTGLPADFMGGEVSFNSLKNGRQNYTYCKLGNAYLGFYNSCNITGLIMTLRTPNQIRPTTVFDKRIGTYHNTWLEKMVADYYCNFTKPKVSSSLKKLQGNSYYDIVLHEKKDGYEIYRNTFLEGTVNYVAIKGEEILITSTLEEMRERL